MPGADLQQVTSAHIVFCELVDGTAQVDCVSESAETRGWPFTLVLALPVGAEWSEMAARLLACWTNDARSIDIRLDPPRGTVRLRMSDGRSAMRLDLLEARLDSVA